VKNKPTIFLVLFMILTISPVLSEIRLVPEYKEYKVVYNAGQETLTEVTNYTAGDVIEFQIIYRNAGDERSNKFIIIGTIPGNTEYIERTATVSDNTPPVFSTDGGKTYNPENNTGSYYTHIRWDIQGGLNPGDSMIARYRVKVVR